jgi:hypothetical protein
VRTGTQISSKYKLYMNQSYAPFESISKDSSFSKRRDLFIDREIQEPWRTNNASNVFINQRDPFRGSWMREPWRMNDPGNGIQEPWRMNDPGNGIQEPWSMNNGNEKIWGNLKVEDIKENGILNKQSFQSTKASSIFDIVYDAYCNHNDIILTKDATLSQFFAILEQCEKHKIFGSVKSKRDIIINVPGRMNNKQLQNLPNNFVKNIDVGVFGENLKNKKELFLQIMKNCSLGTMIFGMAGFGKRYNYVAYTLCKVPEIQFSAPREEMAKILTVLLEFKNIKTIQLKQYSEPWKCHKALLSYLTFLVKVYNAQYMNKKDIEYFHNLIQKNNSSGGPVTGSILDMNNCSSESQVHVKRVIENNQYPDLVYSSKLVSLKQGNNLIFDVVSCVPENDTTN